MPRPRIAHVDAERGFSGGEVQVFLLLEGLRERGHECVLVCPQGSACEARAKERGFPVRTARMASDLDLSSVASLKRTFEDERPDLVHLHTGRATWLGGLAARLVPLPVITTRRMDRPIRRGWRQRLVYGPLVSCVAAISPAVRAALLEGGVPAEKITLIPSAVDPRALAPRVDRESTRRTLEVPEPSVVVLTLASLVRRKGLDVLLEALARAARRDVVVWIAGDGPERRALEAQADALGLASRVRFLGRRDDAADLLAGCDVFALPSRREGLGVSALEAMAARRPIVASRVGGLADAVVDGRTGVLVPADDPEELARAVDRLAGDAALRGRLGDAGPARVAEGFLADQMVASYEELYARVLAGARRPRSSPGAQRPNSLPGSQRPSASPGSQGPSESSGAKRPDSSTGESHA